MPKILILEGWAMGIHGRVCKYLILHVKSIHPWLDICMDIAYLYRRVNIYIQTHLRLIYFGYQPLQKAP
jgi:hypothetical protein